MLNMTRKRFKKLLMGRCGYSKRDAEDAAALVSYHNKGLTIHFPGDNFKHEYEAYHSLFQTYVINDEEVLCKLIEIFDEREV